jgi:hypothetical protein
VRKCDEKAHTNSTTVKIHIQSTPPGAEIYSGTYFGKTPGHVQLVRGDYERHYELRLPGYHTQKLVICPTETFLVPIRLRPLRAGSPQPSKAAPSLPQQPAPSALP